MLAVPDLDSSAFSPTFTVLVPQHGQPVIVKVVDHCQAEAAFVADVFVAFPVHGAAQTRVDVVVAQI